MVVYKYIFVIGIVQVVLCFLFWVEIHREHSEIYWKNKKMEKEERKAIEQLARNNTKSTPVHKDNELNFLVVGDFGGTSSPPYWTEAQMKNAKAMADGAEKINAKFVLALGDNFYDDGVTNVDDPRFKQTFEDVYTQTSLQIPWYVIAGNHDYMKNVSAQIAYTKKSPRWNFPSLYYKVEKTNPGAGTMEIILLDHVSLCQTTLLDGGDPMPWGLDEYRKAAMQWDWLERSLKESRADYLIVAGHYPVWSVGAHGPTKCLVDRLRPLLHKHKVSAYLSGHDHVQTLIEDTLGGVKIPYVISGCANGADTYYDHIMSIPVGSLKFLWNVEKGPGGHLQVRTSKDRMIFSFIEGNGDEQFSFEVYPRNFDNDTLSVNMTEKDH